MFNFILTSVNYFVKFTAVVLIIDNLCSNKLSNFCTNNKHITKLCDNSLIIAKCIKSIVVKKIFTNEPIKIGRNKYLFTYTLNNKDYCLIINKKSGPKKILQAIDENNNDITRLITAFAGPDEDFHNSKITPKTLKYQEVTLNTSNGESILFKENELINVVN
jgi:hypothetical protein